MPVIGPHESPLQVEKAYSQILDFLKKEYNISFYPNYPFLMGGKENSKENWDERLATFKESLRRLFELDSWEGF
jgi:hypothetical protein